MAEYFAVDGPARLSGRVKLSGSKNAALPIIVASTLAGGSYRLGNVPDLLDVRNLLAVLEELGIGSDFRGNELTLDTSSVTGTTVGKESAHKIRYSLLLMGALLSRCGRVRVAPPGGCKLGLRKYDLHLYGLQKLGAEIEATEDFIDLRAPNGLVGDTIDFYFASMTATENVMLAAVTAKGRTVINNAQRDPEIVDFAAFLNSMGARITGAGTERIVVSGVDELRSIDYTVMPDRMELVTLAAAAAATRSSIFVSGGRLEHITPEAAALRRMGLTLEQTAEGVEVSPPRRIAGTEIEAKIWPQVHSDVQPMFTVLACLADGPSRITDALYDGRFIYVDELAKMGAQIEVTESDIQVPSGQPARTALVTPIERFRAAEVTATDIRGGAALLVAAMAAEGRSAIASVDQIDRGYEHIDAKMNGLGADVQRYED